MFDPPLTDSLVGLNENRRKKRREWGRRDEEDIARCCPLAEIKEAALLPSLTGGERRAQRILKAWEKETIRLRWEILFFFICSVCFAVFLFKKEITLCLLLPAALRPPGFTLSFMQTCAILSSLVDQLRYTYKPDRIHLNGLSSKNLLSPLSNLIWRIRTYMGGKGAREKRMKLRRKAVRSMPLIIFLTAMFHCWPSYLLDPLCLSLSLYHPLSLSLGMCF